MTIIGEELLPNIYIDKINLFDDYTETSVYCVDSDTTPEWSDHPLAMTYYKMMVVSTTSPSLINLMRFGYIKMDYQSIIKEDPDAIIDLYPINAVERFTVDNMRYFKSISKQTYSNSNATLNIYAAVVVNPVSLAGSKFVYTSYIQGPTAAESVLAGGNLTTQTTVWNLPDNQQWIGPVHAHPTQGYMQGSKHTEEDHSAVQRTTIGNLKLKDRRTYTYLQQSGNKKIDPSPEISDLFQSFNQKGNYKNVFFLDLREMVLKSTKFGNVLYNASPDLFNSILANLLLRSLKIKRDKVKTNYMNNTLKATNVLQTKTILSSYQQPDGSFVITSKVRQAPTGNISPLSQSPGVNVRKIVFPFDPDIACFEFIDTEITHNFGGEYRYSIDISFNDPTIAQAETIIQELLDSIKSLDSYIGRIRRKLKYNKASFSPPQSWIESEYLLFGDNLDLAPWVMAPRMFAKYKHMFFNVTNSERDAIEMARVSMIEPSTFTIKAIVDFKAELSLLYKNINDIFNIKTSPVVNYSTRSMPKQSRELSKNLIQKKYDFKQIIQPKSNERFYNFLETEATDALGTKRITTNKLKQRIATEYSKFFSGNTTPQAGGSPLEDLKTSKGSYFSPFAVSLKGLKTIPLTNLPEIDKKEFNDFFDNVKIAKVRSPSVRHSLRKRTQVFQDDIRVEFTGYDFAKEDATEKYIHSREFLGKDSNFNTPTETETTQKSRIETSKESINKIKKKILKRSTESYKKLFAKEPKSIFSLINTRLAPRAKNGVALIPNQLKALNASFVKSKHPNSKLAQITKPIFIEEELEEIENDLLIAVNYLTLTQIETLAGFQMNSKGNRIMKAPIWNIISEDDIDDLSNGALCKIESVKSPMTNYQSDPRVELPHAEKYFVIADVELPSINLLSSQQQASTIASSIHTDGLNYNIIGATSDIIVQLTTDQEEIFKTAIEGTPSDVDLDYSVTSFTGGGGRTFSGGSGGGYSGGGGGY
jgi:hypothetical protein